MNSREVPFTRVVCSVSPSRWPMRPSCILVLSIPFFLAFQFWFLSLTSTLRADRTVTKLVSNLSFKISFLLGPPAVRRSSRRGFESGRQQRHKCHLEGGNIYKAEPKICMLWYSAFHFRSQHI